MPNPIPALTKRSHLSISKRDADCYDVYDGDRRVAALRSDFTEDAQRIRTMTPGTWIIRWEFKDGQPTDLSAGGSWVKMPKEIEGLTFQTVHDAFAFFCSQVLE